MYLIPSQNTSTNEVIFKNIISKSSFFCLFFRLSGAEGKLLGLMPFCWLIFPKQYTVSLLIKLNFRKFKINYHSPRSTCEEATKHMRESFTAQTILLLKSYFYRQSRSYSQRSKSRFINPLSSKCKKLPVLVRNHANFRQLILQVLGM